ncbi:GNAT family N-acetyltransferase [Thalassospira povalilytica]|uniref:GNAT family N-acetyltransferase n=1 Tax=Thalassospira povalilytica TaxID=732237 RepID=UPI003AA89162
MLHIKIRECRAEDSLDILSWRNDPTTRAMSLNSDLITIEQHEKWFTQTLSAPDSFIFIGEIDGDKVGMVRFDRVSGQLSAKVSINLNPKHRGQRKAVPLLRACVEKFRQIHSHEIIAVVRIDNAASNNTFKSAGFLEGESKPEHGILYYTLN